MSVASGDDTLLVLSGVGVPSYSARGLTQSLEPIDAAAQLRRSINGALLDLTYAPFRKYKSTISCADLNPPSVDGIWPGHVVEVECVAELSYPESGGMPARTAVSGSERTQNGYVFYRPILDMMVVGFSAETDEYGAIVSWQMQLEEI